MTCRRDGARHLARNRLPPPPELVWRVHAARPCHHLIYNGAARKDNFKVHACSTRLSFHISLQKAHSDNNVDAPSFQCSCKRARLAGSSHGRHGVVQQPLSPARTTVQGQDEQAEGAQSPYGAPNKALPQEAQTRRVHWNLKNVTEIHRSLQRSI